jgi:hypothetical protein
MSQKAFKFALLATFGTVLLAAAPARAQENMPMPGFQLGGAGPQMTPEQKERSDANEKAAKEALRSVKAPKVSNDPWGDVRAADTPKTTRSKAGAK